jgi:hypothetical protein
MVSKADDFLIARAGLLARIPMRTERLVYASGREPRMRISTSLFALCLQSGPDATLETPIRARSRKPYGNHLQSEIVSVYLYFTEILSVLSIHTAARQ